MKLIAGIIAGVILVAGILSFSVFGGAISEAAGDAIKENSSVGWDINVAKAKVKELEGELRKNNGSLAKLDHRITVTKRDIGKLETKRDSLKKQMQGGVDLLKGDGDSFTINGSAYTRSQIEMQLNEYVNEYNSAANDIQFKQEQLASLQGIYNDAKAKIAKKSAAVEQYKNQLQRAESEAEFLSSVDEFDSITGTTNLEEDLLDIEAKISSKKPVASTTGGISFTDGPAGQSAADRALEALAE